MVSACTSTSASVCAPACASARSSLSRRLAVRTVAATALVLASGMPAALLPAWGQDAGTANAPADGAGGMGKTPAAVSVLSIVEHPSLDALRDGLHD